MKRVVLFLILLMPLFSFSQSWTAEQLAAANTADAIDYLSEPEKAAIQYINLARLYPRLFAKYELANYELPGLLAKERKDAKFRKSLDKELKSRQPVPALQFDKKMYDLAACFAKESGDAGAVSHNRKTCTYGYMGECCSYGMAGGKDIAMQWLIDAGIKNVAHRVNCLSKDFTVIGLAVHTHKVYRNCAVADFH